MKRISSIISLLLLVCILVGSLASCEGFGGDKNPEAEQQHEHVDYVSQLKLDMNSSTLKLEVTVKYHIDGDTTHFNVPTSIDETGVMKARYLAVNTPESTGKIEEWGKKASAFTEERVMNAHSIIVESNSDRWNYDGNGRYLVWVWYQAEEGDEYRNLNMELLQEGLAAGSKTSDTIYGEMAQKAIAQATIEKLYIFSDELDPDYPYGEAAQVTLKELRLNIADYVGKKVSVEGVVTLNSNNTEYIQEYDPETGLYFGIQVFDAYQNQVNQMLSKGTRVRLVGVVQEHLGTYQLSDIKYNVMKPNDPANSSLISRDNDVVFTETSPEVFFGNKEIEVTVDDTTTTKTYMYADLVMSTAISMKNLEVVDVYTTDSTTASNGAMTLTCQYGDVEITVRTVVLKDADGDVVTEDYFIGQTIDVSGIVELYRSDYSGDLRQIKVYLYSDIVIH